MPRLVGPPPARGATFDLFVVLRDPIYHLPQGGEHLGSRWMLNLENEPLDLWVDPDSSERQGVKRAVWLEPFVR
jgi:hypothetical protein